MTRPTKTFHRLLEKVQKRFVRARPGSVLILVVALLVLMALIGTAFLSTTNYDRYLELARTRRRGSVTHEAAERDCDVPVHRCGAQHLALGHAPRGYADRPGPS